MLKIEFLKMYIVYIVTTLQLDFDKRIPTCERKKVFGHWKHWADGVLARTHILSRAPKCYYYYFSINLDPTNRYCCLTMII